MSEFDFGSLLEKKKEVQEEKKDSKTEEIETIEAPTPEARKTTKKVLPVKDIVNIEKQKIVSKSNFVGGISEGYRPHGTDIMTAHKLITGKSIREFKGKGTNKALLEGLTEKCNEMLKKLQGAGDNGS